MVRSLCVWLAVVALAKPSGCDSDSPGARVVPAAAHGHWRRGRQRDDRRQRRQRCRRRRFGGGRQRRRPHRRARRPAGGPGRGHRLPSGNGRPRSTRPQYPTAIPLNRAPAVFADVICEKVFGCCSSEERGTSPFLSSQAGCASGLDLPAGRSSRRRRPRCPRTGRCTIPRCWRPACSSTRPVVSRCAWTADCPPTATASSSDRWCRGRRLRPAPGVHRRLLPGRQAHDRRRLRRQEGQRPDVLRGRRVHRRPLQHHHRHVRRRQPRRLVHGAAVLAANRRGAQPARTL